MTGRVSVRVVDREGGVLDSDVVLASLYITGSPLYDVVSVLTRVSNVGDLFSCFWKKGFKVRFSKEKGVFEAEHAQYPVKAILHPQEDGDFVLEVIVPDLGGGEHGERALLGAWRAMRMCNELRGELEKLRERIGQLEDRLKELREELRVMVENVDLKVERLRARAEGEEVGEEEQE
jgi:hypothetical protein